jgi:xanthine/uracil permease
VAIAVWSKGKLRLFSVIIGMVTGYIVSHLTGLLPEAHFKQIWTSPFWPRPIYPCWAGRSTPR